MDEAGGVGSSSSDRVESILAEIDAADTQLVQPPADLWTRIEAAAGARSPKEAPRRAPGAPTVVEYRIDAADVVVEVGQGWAGFARDNDAAELAAVAPQRTLWSYFDDAETRELWRLVVEGVRTTGSGVEVPLRCDGPEARRWFELQITPGPDRGVRFRCVLAFEEARSSVPLLDVHATRDTDLPAVPLCSWCGRAEHGGEWLAVEDLVRSARLFERSALPPVAHGICESCRSDMAADLLVPGASAERTD